jgi:hypothetical protein
VDQVTPVVPSADQGKKKKGSYEEVYDADGNERLPTARAGDGSKRLPKPKPEPLARR